MGVCSENGRIYLREVQALIKQRSFAL